MDIHKGIRLELREVRAVWRRELARFEETSLSAVERTVQIEKLRRRSLTVLAGTADRIRAAGGEADELVELTQLRAEIASASSADAGLHILSTPVAEPDIERRPSLQRPTGPASRDRHQRQP
jgi:hypothetical protein